MINRYKFFYEKESNKVHPRISIQWKTRATEK